MSWSSFRIAMVILICRIYIFRGGFLTIRDRVAARLELPSETNVMPGATYQLVHPHST
jgi:hypothetical protein